MNGKDGLTGLSVLVISQEKPPDLDGGSSNCNGSCSSLQYSLFSGIRTIPTFFVFSNSIKYSSMCLSILFSFHHLGAPFSLDYSANMFVADSKDVL